MPRLCSVEGCDTPHYCKSFCRLHYSRWKAHGDPHAGRTHGPPEERFWRYVDKRGPDECWPWTGTKQKSGYGRFFLAGDVKEGAHRVSFQIAHNGFLPPVVMHTCDNPICVNPAHLRAGTMQSNFQDMVAKGRQNLGVRPKGTHHFKAKLTEADVREIRATKDRLDDVAKRYGVGRGAIDKIRARQNWKHVT